MNVRQNLAKLSTAATLAVSPFAVALADTTDPSTQVFSSISLTGIVAGVLTLAAVGLGISMAFKAWQKGNKAVNRV